MEQKKVSFGMRRAIVSGLRQLGVKRPRGAHPTMFQIPVLLIVGAAVIAGVDFKALLEKLVDEGKAA